MEVVGDGIFELGVARAAAEIDDFALLAADAAVPGDVFEMAADAGARRGAGELMSGSRPE